MNTDRRPRIDALKQEAHRYANARNWMAYKQRKYGWLAIAISYSGLIPIIALGGTGIMPLSATVACFGLVVLSAPFWLKAGHAQRAQ